jgi:benzoylformate decarboxylase
MPHSTAVEALVHLLAESGVRYLFGNPGSMEFPLVDALARQERISYILGLHEVPVIGMADGYAQASGGLGVANVHISPGLGNSMGMLYNAWRSGTPVLLTAGQQDRRLAFEEPVLWSDLARVAEPYTKLAIDIQRADDLPRAVRRAVQLALTPPTGPVFLALPLDLQTETAEYDLTPPVVPDRRIRPPRRAVAAATNILLSAERPAILAGCRVAEATATLPLLRLAEILGATIHSDPVASHGRLSVPADYPLYGGAVPLFAGEARALLGRYDVILAVGMDLISQYFYRGEAPLPASVRLLHLDASVREIGKNYAPAVALIGDPLAGLEDLVAGIESGLTPEGRAAAAERTRQASRLHDDQRSAARAAAEADQARQPLTGPALMHAVAAALPREAVIVDEAVTASRLDFERFGWLRDPLAYYGQRGWGLGWGVGAALGVALALPGRPVIGLLGEGSLLYGIQGLWTAAHHEIPVVYIVSNNASYAILKAGMLAAKLPSAMAGNFLGMDLIHPEIDYPAMARALGIQASRVETASQVSDAVAAAIQSGRPALIDVPIDRSPGPDRR